MCFWCQLWLSVIAATVAIFSVQYAYSGSAAAFGLGFTMISTAASFLSTLWTLRCRRIGKLLRREVETKDGKRPTKVLPCRHRAQRPLQSLVPTGDHEDWKASGLQRARQEKYGREAPQEKNTNSPTQTPNNT